LCPDVLRLRGYGSWGYNDADYARRQRTSDLAEWHGLLLNGLAGSEAFPQQRRRVGHHDPGRLHRVLGTEVLVVLHLAGQVDDQRQRFLRRVCPITGAARS